MHLIKHHAATKTYTYGRVEVQFHHASLWRQMVSGQIHAPAALPPDTYWIRGWAGPRAGLDAVKYRKISCPYRQSNTPVVSLFTN
jgi:hypothetical protein